MLYCQKGVLVSGEKLGSPENPVHMAVTKGRGSTFRSELWGMLRMVVGLVIVSFIFLSMLSSTVFNSVKNSSECVWVRMSERLCAPLSSVVKNSSKGMHVCIYVHVYVYVRVCICVCLCMQYVCTYVCKCLCVCAHYMVHQLQE